MAKVVVARKLCDSNPRLVESLRNDFLAYKSSMHETIPVLPRHFGRDAPFEYPASAANSELFHLHLNDIALGFSESSSVVAGWKDDTPQYYRTSDCFLIYTIGEQDRETYILLAIVNPHAHEQIRSNDLIGTLVAMAEAAKAQF